MKNFQLGQIQATQDRIERKLDAIIEHFSITVPEVPEHSRPYIGPYDHGCGCNDGTGTGAV